MIYHGKKTVPATLRKDMWVPYYSVHFNDSKIGLRAYHLLREFSMQRQLSPPREMITITEELLARKRPQDLTKAKEFDEKFKGKVGKLMPPEWRTRVVMDQKATSVADIAAVLAIQEEEIKNGFADGKRGYLTRTARKRRREARQKEQEIAAKNAERVAEFEREVLNAKGFLKDQPLELKIQVPDEDVNSEYHLEGDQVKILWNDIHDAAYAESWSDRVTHGELRVTRDHVMPGQKLLLYGLDTLANHGFKERE